MNENRLVEAFLKEGSHDSLITSEMRYRRLFESAKDGILIVDAQSGKIEDVNPFLINLLGYTHDKFINKFIWDIGLFRDITPNKENFLLLKEKKYIRYEDLPLETADGRHIAVEFVSNVYQEGDHDVIQCNIRDITERKRTADILDAERERLLVTLRSISDGVIATDAQGNIEIMNTVAEELCGWKEDDARRKPLSTVFAIINENTRQPHENPVKAVLESGGVVEQVNSAVMIAKDGTERLISESAAPIRNNANRIIGVVMVFRDITEKEKLLEASQRNQRLESLGLLAGGIAHDFNNLMGGIFGYIDLAMGESKDEGVVQLLSKAMATIERSRGLTRQLLTFAKGGGPIQETISIAGLIQDAARFALSGSTVSPLFDISEDLWMCNIDRHQISQVIDNIVINARQAMPAGGPLRICARNVYVDGNKHPVLHKGNYVRISIKDAGAGITKKNLPRIFDPFFTTKDKGHGLGLATCYSIVSRHCGAIDVASVVGEGTVVHVYLPAKEDLSSPSISAEIRHSGCGKIIVLDDEEVMRETIGSMLESFGYTVECKDDGKKAIASFIEEYDAKRAVSAMILDLTVPGGMGGKDVIGKIRKIDPRIPVFVASGYGDDPVMTNPANYGFTASICKPFRRIELAEMLEKHMLRMK
jgi:two-component system cell cycle sensor histidine kinase/response regulator CckA